MSVPVEFTLINKRKRMEEAGEERDRDRKRERERERENKRSL